MKSVHLGVVLVLAMLAVSTLDENRIRAGVGTGSISGTVVASQTNQPLPYANVMVVGTTMGAMSLGDGRYEIKGVPAGTYTVKAMMMAYASQEEDSVVVKAGETTSVSFVLAVKAVTHVQECTVTADGPVVRPRVTTTEKVVDMPVDDVVDAIGLKGGIVKTGDDMRVRGGRPGEVQIQIDGVSPADPPGRYQMVREPWTIPTVACPPPAEAWRYRPANDREQYEATRETGYLEVVANPLSTFSIDVDRASYGNVRRFVRADRLPPPDAVRVEEFLNYFTYDYPEPVGEEPFSVSTEVASCPWNDDHRLVRIALQGRRIDTEKLPPSNLVLLIDVSGSMGDPNKLSLVKQALPFLVLQLRAVDRVAMVVYAGSARIELDTTSGDRKWKILRAIRNLRAGGSTAGAEALVAAYDIAQENFVKGGTNRVILVTDGDFNVGVTSDGDLVRLIEKKRETGVFLTVIGVGEGNLQDAKMEKIADRGNGNYSYIEDLVEARKVFVDEMAGTLATIAKDVKIQVEFNPTRVRSYRLIGYENRTLAKEDFTDDKKDAGDLGSGHTVTALYEIELAANVRASDPDELRYVNVGIKPDAFERDEALTVKLRYKAPNGDESLLIERTALDLGTSFASASVDFRFAAAVAELSMILRDSEFMGSASFDHVIETAREAQGKDVNGYRAEFVELAETCKSLKPEVSER